MKLGGNDRGEGKENGKRTEKREREREGNGGWVASIMGIA